MAQEAYATVCSMNCQLQSVSMDTRLFRISSMKNGGTFVFLLAMYTLSQYATSPVMMCVIRIMMECGETFLGTYARVSSMRAQTQKKYVQTKSARVGSRLCIGHCIYINRVFKFFEFIDAEML